MLRTIPVRLRWAVAGLLVGHLAGPSPARAEPATAPPAPETPRDRAAAFAAQGHTLMHERRYEEAREAYAHAYELDPQSETLMDLGLAERGSDHPVEATLHLRAYLGRKDAPKNNIAAVHDSWLPRAEARTTRLRVFVRAGVDIRVDGAIPERDLPAAIEPGPAPQAPFGTFLIAAGQHEVTARDGPLLQSEHVVARGGEEVDVHFQRLPDAPTEAPSPVSGTLPGPAPNETPAAGHSGTPWIPFIAVEAAAVVAAGTAIGFGLAYDHFRSEADFLNGQVGPSGCLPMNADPQCPQLHSDRHTERTDAAIAEGLYATAGALAVLGGVLWLVWPAPRGGSSARLLHPIVWTADRTTGAAITGSW